MHDLDETIRERRSVRGFVPDRLVPRKVIREALELAQRAPSNCNVQPWRLFIASGVGCDRLRSALRQAVTTGVAPAPDDPVDGFPGAYRQLQVDCAVALYKEMGIERNDQAGRLHAFARNFEFFDAPHVAIVCMEKHFKLGVALDVGMYVQTLMLALWARGVASCAQASLRMYPAIIRQELSIPESLRIMCGVSFGYEDIAVAANRSRQRRSRSPRRLNSRISRDLETITLICLQKEPTRRSMRQTGLWCLASDALLKCRSWWRRTLNNGVGHDQTSSTARGHRESLWDKN